MHSSGIAGNFVMLKSCKCLPIEVLCWQSVDLSGCAVFRSDADFQQAAHVLGEAVAVATGRAFSNAAGL